MRSNPLNLFLTSTVKSSGIGFRSYLNGRVVFPIFFNLSLRSSWSEPQSTPGLISCWLYRASPSLAAKNTINLTSVLTIWWCLCVESSLVLLEEGVYIYIYIYIYVYGYTCIAIHGYICMYIYIYIYVCIYIYILLFILNLYWFYMPIN